MGWVTRRRGAAPRPVAMACGWAQHRPGASSTGLGAVGEPCLHVWGARELIPCGMPQPGERGRRLGAGSVGFQGSCRAGAATGTDGGRAGPGRALRFWPCLAALPWPWALLSLWPVGWDGSCPGLCPGLRAQRRRVAGGTRHPPAPLPARPGLREVFPSARRCQPALEAFARLAAPQAAPGCVTAALLGGHPSEPGHAWCHRGYCPQSRCLWGRRAPPAHRCRSGAALGNWGGGVPGCSPGTFPATHQAHGHLAGRSDGDTGCAGSGPGDGPASCSRKYPEGCWGLRGGRGWLCPPRSPGWVNPAGTRLGLLGGQSRTPSPSLSRWVLLWVLRPGVGAGGPWDLGCTRARSAGGAGGTFPGSLGLPLGLAGSGAGWRSGTGPCLQSPHFAPC